jgi:PadR family transcriptional regulator, regulatory protein AphA
MAAKHVLLGLLLDRPAYPYQLADRMQQRLGPSWTVRSGPLYQAVKGLERDGMIERVNKDPDGQDERHVFQITERGVEEFERWFEQAPDTVRSSRPLLVKITFAGPERLARAMGKVEDYERECAERLSAIAVMCEALPGPEQELVRADHLLLRLNLSSDIYALEGELRWAQDARELLTSLSEEERAVWPNGSGGEGRTLGASARSQLFTRIARDAGEDEEHTETARNSDTARERSPAPKRAAG